MTGPTALLTFGIGPVHELISAARRVADVWAGSDLLSHLMGAAIEKARAVGGAPVFPAVDSRQELAGIPNRVVLRVPRDRADRVAEAMRQAVEEEWTRLAGEAVEILRTYKIEPSDAIWPPTPSPARPRQTDRVFDIAWSWVAEDGDYAEASRRGARRYAASRLFRPFEQMVQTGEKCALCGSRTALPNGARGDVRQAWEAAEEEAEKASDKGDQRFFRYDQGRLCLVCATKRLYTRSGDKKVYFQALDRFDRAEESQSEESAGARGEERRYVAVVAMDGDRMSEILAFGSEKVAGSVESFHRAVSSALGSFARSLRRSSARDPLAHAQLDLDALGIRPRGPIRNRPQLLYAGGDDVLVVCAPADALQVARGIRERFLAEVQSLREHLKHPEDLDRLTLSGAIVYAHSKFPAGLLFLEAHDLLKRKAKGEAGRNALAIRLMKRSGVPVEVAFQWDGAPEGVAAGSWLRATDELVERLQVGSLSSTQTFNLRREEEVLLDVFGEDTARWIPWLEDRLSRGEATSAEAADLAQRIAPYFVHRKTEALRIVRFLGVEVKA